LQSYDDAGNEFETTAPDGKVTRKEHDALRRVIKEVENYAGGAPGTDTDKTTLFTYAPDGGIATLTLKNSVTGDQVTRWEYGTTLFESGVATSHLLSLKIYPDDDDAGGAPDRVSFAYTRQQLLKTTTDQKGNVHTFGYDLRARKITDAVTMLGANTDGAVRRIETVHDDLDRETGIVSFDAATGGNVVNAKQKKYNGYGQQITNVQEHVGAVTNVSLEVNYEYVNGTGNCITWLGTNYPNRRQIDAVFNTNIDEFLGRPGSLHDSVTGGVIADYARLGTDIIVSALYPECNVLLSRLQYEKTPIGDGGDQYDALDRFGRIIDQRWEKFASHQPLLDRYLHTYNRASLRLTRKNIVSASLTPPVFLDELYGFFRFFCGQLGKTC
jgi:YD repeat-containing protein